MGKKQRIIFLIVISIIITIILSIGLTTAFMKPIEQGGNLTEIALSSCAKIKLTSTSSINLSNTYPMSRNKGLETTPYSFTVTSYCDTYVGFNLYIATLSTNTLDASNIHYILTEKGGKNIIKEGILSSVTSGVSDFSDTEKTELNVGLKGTYGNIYKLYNESIDLKGSKEYSLYLYVDETATNDTMNKTFNAGIAVKAYERSEDNPLAEYIITQFGSYQGSNNLYYHDTTLDNGARDDSYRYAGPSDSVSNFVCFGSKASTCPYDNLYRIIGVFDGKVKLIKYDYMTADELGTDGDYVGTYDEVESDGQYRGNYGRDDKIGYFLWNHQLDSTNELPLDTWSTSQLNKINLNKNFINYLGTEWANKIAITTWKVGGNTWENIAEQPPWGAFNYEITEPSTDSFTGEITYDAKIGLMYVSDFGYASDPSGSGWTDNMYNETMENANNWMFMGLNEWTITREAEISDSVFVINNLNYVYSDAVESQKNVRAVFYLEPFVTYLSGSGTEDDPIRIN